jgi:hypothetical protein
VVAQRGRAPVGDIAGAVDNLLTHYEEMGTGVLRLLAQEETVPLLGPILQMGREAHYRWVEATFRPFLDSASDPSWLRAALIAASDIYVWKILHLDLGMEGDEVRNTLTGMVTALTERETA